MDHLDAVGEGDVTLPLAQQVLVDPAQAVAIAVRDATSFDTIWLVTEVLAHNVARLGVHRGHVLDQRQEP
eukprot:7643259-Pyramimonas_sp.AAC.1